MPLLFLSDQAYAPPGTALANAAALGLQAVTLAQVTAADWSLMLDATAAQVGLATGVGAVVQGLDDVSQCIAIILNTPKGADPLRPTFGCDLWQFIDAPITLAIPHIVREVTEALTIWEPRIRVIAVTAKLRQPGSNSNYPANLVVSITWQLKLAVGVGPAALQAKTTVVTIASGLRN